MPLFSPCFVAAFFLWTLAAGLLPPAAVAAQGPEASVAMLQKAVDTRDMALAERYLDIDGITAKAVDVLVADPALLQSLGNKAIAIAVALAAAGNEKANPVLKELLQSEAREYVRNGVVSGIFAGNVVEGASTYAGLFKKAFRGGKKNTIAFGPAKVLKQEGGSALVATMLAQGVKGRAYPLELRLERRGDVWRVVELANAKDFVQKAMKKDAK